MKRLILLAVVILLSVWTVSCEESPQNMPSPPAETATPSDPAPSVTAVSPTPVDPPPAPSTPETGSTGISVALPNGPLPDKPYTKLENPRRFYADTMLGLVPSDKYGRIIPYVGGIIHSEVGSYYLYGLCDLSGRIVCDPVYNEVRTVSNGETSLYTLHVYKEPSIMIPEDEYTYEGNSTIQLCPLDGRWTAVYDGVEGSGANLTVQKDGKWGVIDYDNNVILPFQYLEPVRFSEGLAAALSDDGETMWYIDITGERILGPYDNPPIVDRFEYEVPRTYGFLFSKGYALFYQNEKYGVVDAMGMVIIPAAYDYVENMGNGMFAYELDEKQGVITSEGKLAMETSNGGDFYVDGQSVIFRDWYKEDDDREILPDGTVRPYHSSYNPGALDRTSVEINGKTISFPESTYYYPSVTPLPNGKYLVCYNKDTYESARWRLYDKDANPVSDEVLGHAYYIDLNDIGVIESGDWLYDLDGNLLFSEAFIWVRGFDDYLMGETENYYGVFDAKGNYIIKVSLLDCRPD